MQPCFHPSRRVLWHHVIIKWCLRYHVQLIRVLSRLCTRMRPGCVHNSEQWRIVFVIDRCHRCDAATFSPKRTTSDVLSCQSTHLSERSAWFTLFSLLTKEYARTTVLRDETKIMLGLPSSMCVPYSVTVTEWRWQWPIDLVYRKSVWKGWSWDRISSKKKKKSVGKSVSDET